MVGAGSDSVCLAAGVLLWRGGLSAGRLTQAIAATWVRIPATAPATIALWSCLDCSGGMHFGCVQTMSYIVLLCTGHGRTGDELTERK